jgi:hypothetical protein
VFILADVKGTTLVYLQQEFKRKGEAAEKKFLSRISPDEAKLYQSALPIAWFPLEPVTRILAAGAEVLFPGDAQGLRKLGHGMAQDNLTGIYKILIKLTTVPFLIAQVAKLWGTYHKQGRAYVIREGEAKRAVLVVEDYPEMPAKFRELNSGYIIGALELTNAKKVTVEHDGSDPEAWKWVGTWE